MKYCFFIAMFAFLLVACSEVGNAPIQELPGSSGEIPGGSSGGIDPSSSSGESKACPDGVRNCCNGAEFNVETNFCYEDELYPRCGSSDYNPFEKGCFDGKLYPKCSLDATRGICVHESLLRCRQEGTGENKYVIPQPDMTCQENGSITGTRIEYYGGTAVEYKIVQIGNQIWLAENLKFDPLLPADYNTLDKGNYGVLYDWAASMALPYACNGTNERCPERKGNGLWSAFCPTGFGMPKQSDWEQLINYAGGVAAAGGRLKSKTGWSNNGNGTDNYGFNAKPGGYMDYANEDPQNQKYLEESSESHWWMDDASKYTEANFLRIISSDTEAKIAFHQKGVYMAYVRCLHYF